MIILRTRMNPFIAIWYRFINDPLQIYLTIVCFWMILSGRMPTTRKIWLQVPRSGITVDSTSSVQNAGVQPAAGPAAVAEPVTVARPEPVLRPETAVTRAEPVLRPETAVTRAEPVLSPYAVTRPQPVVGSETVADEALPAEESASSG
jgi:hypothetical protein